MYPDCSRAQSDWAFAQLRPQAPIHPMTAPFGQDDVVIALARDAAVDPDWQVSCARTYGARLITLDSGHSPFLTQPDELAAVLSDLA
jgi:pimeloyl-ACP methyl ester carboxylesterase